MGNALSNLVLLAWPLVCLIAFARFKPTVAVLVSFMGAMLFLPEKVELPSAFQPLGKPQMAAIGALLGVLLVGSARRKLFGAKLFRGPEIFILLMMAGAFATSKTNTEPLNYTMAFLPPLSMWEAVSVCVGDVYSLLIPFVLGRALFTTREDAVTLLRAFQLGALIYLPFIMTEIIMSPQMHNWVYGFAQHDFSQTVRGGGYRPMVFMGHGLGLTLFVAAACLAGIVLSLAGRPTLFRLPGRWVSGFLLVVLLACKSLGAAVLAVLFAGLLHFLLPRWQLRVLMLLVVVIFAYPISRATEVFPHKELVQLMKDTAGEGRAGSMEFRFTNEAELSEHAAKKPWFGWGRFRRNMLFAPWSKEAVSVSDGYWIVVYGVRGAVGFLCFFALLLSPVVILRRRYRQLRTVEDRYLLVGMACIVMMYTIDLIPNGLFTNLPVLFAGALTGILRGILNEPPPQTVTVSVTGPTANGAPG